MHPTAREWFNESPIVGHAAHARTVNRVHAPGTRPSRGSIASAPAAGDRREEPAMEERTLSSTRPWTGRRIRVRVDEVERADGHRTRREIVEHPGAVAILAWDGERLATVRQWRHATGREMLEIPAGTLEPNEPPQETARRELAEEAGLTAATWIAGPRFYTAPGFC